MVCYVTASSVASPLKSDKQRGDSRRERPKTKLCGSERHFVFGGRNSILLLEGSPTMPARPKQVKTELHFNNI
jgi:hypothetical protein